MNKVFMSRQPLLNRQSRVIASRWTLHLGKHAHMQDAANALGALDDIWTRSEKTVFISCGDSKCDAGLLDWSAPDNAAMEQKRITPYPLLVNTEDYYGETKYNQFPAKFDAREDNPGPLMIGAALIRGNAGDVNQNKTTGRLVLLGNTDLLQPRQIKPEQRDFMRTLIGWMTDREELRGLGSRHDLTVKLNLDRNALGVLELLTNIGLPLLALLIALIIWNTRRH